MLFWHAPPLPVLATQAPPLQTLDMVPQLVVADVVHAPALLQVVADVAVVRSAEQPAAAHMVAVPGYAH